MIKRTAHRQLRRCACAALLLLCAAVPSVAQQGPPPPGGQGMRPYDGNFSMHDESARILPPGPWWKNQDLVQRLELTADQQKRIDSTFQQNRVVLVRLHSSLDNEQLQLEPLLNSNPIDQAKVMAEISKIADMRAELFKANARMLLQIRGVLTQAQWARLQQERPSRHHMYSHQAPATPSGVQPPPPPQ